MSMTKTDKQALRGQDLPPRYYLAECQGCGVIMPSNKLIEAVNFPDGDADVHCPHCNADDCDIMDLGTGEEPSAIAWNYQQKRIEALLDELEAADSLNKHLELAIRKAEGCSEKLRAGVEAAEKRISVLGGHLKSAHAFIENTEAFGYEAASGILKCGDSEWNVDASKESISAAGIALDTGE